MIREFHPAARDEFVQTALFYEGVISGLGVRFRDAVDRALESIELFPEIGRRRPRGSRCVFVDGFPYDLVYRIQGDILVVVAVAHHRRRPGYWRQRL